jgi:hypothetical protein
MPQYANRNGNSGVAAYKIGNDSICVEFSTGARYLYTYASAGAANIETMKELAIQGSGLNSFINKVVRKNYASKNC